MGGLAELTVTKRTLLIVEGTHERDVVAELLKQRLRDTADSIELIPEGGKTKLAGALSAVSRRFGDLFDDGRTGAEPVQIGILRDADNDSKAAFQSVCQGLSNAGLPTPREVGEVVAGEFSVAEGLALPLRVGVYIMPGQGRKGALEDLCWQAVRDTPQAACVEGFFECLKDAGVFVTEGHRLGKARAHAFIASQEDPEVHVGIAAKRGYWPLASDAFGGLLEFIGRVAHD